MYSIDADIFIYSADSTAQFHTAARQFLENILSTDEPCLLCWETVHAFLRIVSHPSIMKNPMDFRRACDFIRPVIDLPQVSMLSPDAESFRILQDYRKIMPLKGALVSDAIVASLLEANGIKLLYTSDRDFSKFPFLKTRKPF